MIINVSIFSILIFKDWTLIQIGHIANILSIGLVWENCFVLRFLMGSQLFLEDCIELSDFRIHIIQLAGWEVSVEVSLVSRSSKGGSGLSAAIFMGKYHLRLWNDYIMCKQFTAVSKLDGVRVLVCVDWFLFNAISVLAYMGFLSRVITSGSRHLLLWSFTCLVWSWSRK